VTVVRARAVFVGPREVEAGPSRIRARHFVIATGSSPAAPSIPGLKETPFFTNETIFRNRTRPEHLIVVGGGPIGVELAQAFRRLGSNVTLVEALRILNNEDEEAAAVVRASLEAEGVIMREQAGITRVRAASGGVEAELGPEKIRGSHLLVATGRRANIDDMGLEKAGVGVTKKGVAVDSRLRTQNKRIYAVGDAAGGPQFTHLAADHASTVVRNILFKIPAKRRDHLAPRVTFTDPELASIGKSEVETRELGGAVTRWDFTRNDRAATERRTEGFVKAMTDRRGKIIGAVIAGPGAGELIAPYALALAKGLRIKAFTDYIAPYPTRGEALKRAAGAYYAPALFSARARALVRLLALFD
jgi:pyruvate/2-oxoglutarate dehydrogenase complex dihydrolipoamide dehydrogenase (E3) component